MSDLVSLHRLGVTLGSRVLLHDVSLVVGAGESVAILGASGSGKSLTAAALAGALPSPFMATGSLKIDGSPVELSSPNRPRETIALSRQDSSSALNPLVRIGQQLTAPLRRGGATRAQALDRVGELLERCGLDDVPRILISYAAELSGGQRQRVCIALALACNTRLLIADEPTSALDVVSQAQVISALKSARQDSGLALLFITHDLQVAAQLCERVVVMKDGTIVESGSLRDVLERPEHPFTRSLVERAQRVGVFA